MKRRNRQVYRQQEKQLEQAVDLMTAAIDEMTAQRAEINRLRSALLDVVTTVAEALDSQVGPYDQDEEFE